MPKLARELRARIGAKGLNGEPLSILKGDEPLEDLRRMIIRLTEDCPARKSHIHCPFRAMAGLSYTSAKQLINSLSNQSCQGLFELELLCRVSEHHGGATARSAPPVPEPPHSPQDKENLGFNDIREAP